MQVLIELYFVVVPIVFGALLGWTLRPILIRALSRLLKIES